MPMPASSRPSACRRSLLQHRRAREAATSPLGSLADSPQEQSWARRWRLGLLRSMWHRDRPTWWNRNAIGHAADLCGTAIAGFGLASRFAIERSALGRPPVLTRVSRSHVAAELRECVATSANTIGSRRAPKRDLSRDLRTI